MRSTASKLLIIFCLIFTQLPASTIFAAVDITSPVFESLSLDKTDVTVGDTITFTLKASDEGSGLQQYVFLHYDAPITGKDNSITLYYNSTTGNYKGTLAITETMESGDWQLDYFTIYDNDDNTKRVSGPIEGTNFTVTGTTSDVTPPIFESLSLDKTDVTVGDTITFTLKASDQQSGLQQYVFLHYDAPITGKDNSITLYYNSTTGTYKGTLSITETMESGEWQLDYFTIYDNDDNTKRVSGPIEGTSFTVTGTTSDVTPPVFESLSLDKTEVKVGDTITFTLKASDPESGLQQYVFLHYDAPITGKDNSITMYYNGTTGTYKGTLNITETMEPGEWQLDYFTIYDNDDNTKRVSGPIEGTSFTLTGSDNDNTNPTFNTISVNKKVVETSEYINISTNVSDNYLVKSVVVNYLKPVSNQVESITLTPDTKRVNFSSEWYIGTDKEYGDWKVQSVEVTDYNGNKITVTENLSDGKFTIQKPIQPLGNRVIKSNETWSNQTIYGDVYVGPSAVLTILGNVTITGNVFVLGAIKNYGGLSIYGTLNAKSMYYGSWPSSLYNGYVLMSGSNNISSMRISNYPVQSIPIDLYDSPLVVEDGKIDLIGATVPVVDVYLNDQLISLNSNGTFRLNDFFIGNSGEIIFTFRDVFGFVSTKKYSVISDVIAPVVEGVNHTDAYNTDRTITFNEGTALLNGNTITSGTIVTEEGNYHLVVTDTAGNQTMVDFVIDKTSPVLPTADKLSNESTLVTGSAEANATIKVKKDNEVLGTAVANEKGKFSVNIPAQNVGVKLTVTASDKAGNESEPFEVTVQSIPKVNGLTQISKLVTGTTEANNFVYVKVGVTVIGKGKADAEGNFAVEIPAQEIGTKLGVIARDDVGNYSLYAYVTVEKKPAPNAPTVGVVTEQSTYVSGTAEADSTVYVKVGSLVIGRGKTNSQGSYSVDIPVQPLGTKLGIVARDEAGNFSPYTYATVVEKTVPFAPRVNQVTNKSTFVTGTAEINSTVYVKVGSEVIGREKTDAAGGFTIEIPLQPAGTTLGVVVRDEAGKFSPYTYVTVAEQTTPLAAKVNEVTDQSTTVTGTAEINSVVYVKVGSVVIGKGKTASNGSFNITIPVQQAGTKLGVVVRGADGKYSPYTYVTVKAFE